jgi:Mg2+/Co2+ transporter CorC
MIAHLLLPVISGLYLCVCILISSWRHATGGAGGTWLWIGLLGVWAFTALTDLLILIGWNPYIAGPLWFTVALLLATVGRQQGRRQGINNWVWVLGPIDALGLVLSWVAVARQWGKTKPEALETAFPTDSDSERQEAFASVVELGETTVGEVMIPRSEMTLLEDTALVGDWVGTIEKTKFRHVPVYGEDQDEIKGYITIKDLFSRPPSDTPVGKFIRDLRFVPETMRCDDLLRELITQGEQLALVVDEFGGTAGLVRDKDLFEILIGEINSQNPFQGRIFQLDSGEYMADGHYRVDDFNEWSPTLLPEGDYETLAGCILHKMGRIPQEGDKVQIEGVNLDVATATERKIKKIHIQFNRLPVTNQTVSAVERKGQDNGFSAGSKGGHHRG